LEGRSSYLSPVDQSLTLRGGLVDHDSRVVKWRCAAGATAQEVMLGVMQLENFTIGRRSHTSSIGWRPHVALVAVVAAEADQRPVLDTSRPARVLSVAKKINKLCERVIFFCSQWSSGAYMPGDSPQAVVNGPVARRSVDPSDELELGFPFFFCLLSDGKEHRVGSSAPYLPDADRIAARCHEESPIHLQLEISIRVPRMDHQFPPRAFPLRALLVPQKRPAAVTIPQSTCLQEALLLPVPEPSSSDASPALGPSVEREELRHASDGGTAD